MTHLSFLIVALAAANSALCLYEGASPVKVVTPAEFRSLKQSGEPFLAEFFSSGCGHCVQFAPEYEKAAKALKGIVKVVAVEDQSAMAEEGIHGFPTVKFFSSKTDSDEYKNNRTASDLIAYVFTKLRRIVDDRLSGKNGAPASSGGDKKQKAKAGKGDVFELTDTNFEKLVVKEGVDDVWFVEFYAPWCGHCTALAPAWEEMAGTLKGKVKVAKVDATANEMLARHFGIQGFPTLKLFPPHGERGWLSFPSRAVDYSGARKLDDMMSFAMQFAGSAATAEQLLSQEDLNGKCSKGVCLLALLPHILDSKASGRNEQLTILNNVLKATYSMPVTFLWSEGGAQFDFEEALHLAFGFPAVVALNFEKKKFAIHKGSYTEDSLRQFITGMMAGRVSIDTLPQTLPKIVTATAWDGKDEVIPEEPDDEL